MFEERIKELNDKEKEIAVLSTIYERVKQDMQWNAMIYHEPDESHDTMWYTEPQEDDYNHQEFLTYKKVLEMIEKMATK